MPGRAREQAHHRERLVAADSVAVTVTDAPSGTGFGEADRRTVGFVPPSNCQVHCAVGKRSVGR